MIRLLIAVVFLTGLHSRVSGQVSEQDSLALVAIYWATGGPGWHNNDNWLDGPVSTWHGVSAWNGRVYQLMLWDNGLSGHLPDEIGDLTAIWEISIGMADLEGPIPSTIGQLSDLYSLNLRGSGVEGEIPAELGNCLELNTINLGENRLVGEVPASLGQCTKLTWIQIQENQLTGSFPEVFLQMPDLWTLEMSANQFTGPIPAGINDITTLVNLILSDNQFTGPFPVIDRLEALESLLINNNNFTGDPEYILGYHPGLTYIYMQDNQFTGSISEAAFNPSTIVRAHFHNNNLTGMGDFSAWQQAPQFLSLHLSGNRFDFDDLAPNAGYHPSKFFYSPQQTHGHDTLIMAQEGEAIVLSASMMNPEVIYRWYHDGIQLNGATARELVISDVGEDDAGLYYYEAEHPDFDHLTLTSAIFTLIPESTGISAEEQISVEIFPNPTTDKVHIRSTGMQGKKQFQLMRIDGRIIYGDEIVGEEVTLSIAHLEPGIYILQVMSTTGSLVKSLVKK